METLRALRAAAWRTIPEGPGVYWWYFPERCLEQFRIHELCAPTRLRLRRSPSGRVCLYHGRAKSLAERIQWHAAQKLSLGSLKSAFLSTFRLTLLVLNNFDYTRGANEIDTFMDSLEVDWRVFATEAEARGRESAELAGPFHYPLNIRDNRRPELAAFRKYLQGKRKAYRDLHLESGPTFRVEYALRPALQATATKLVGAMPTHPVLALISCTKSKAHHACPARELYRPSTFFRLAFAYAQEHAASTLILSAKHGVVRPEQIIAPYERTLVGTSRAERQRWADMVHRQLHAAPEYQTAKTILWLAGEDYRGELLPSGPGSSAPPKAEEFRRTLQNLKDKAIATGKVELVISAGELHRLVGGYPSKGAHRMPMCCSVMRQQMRTGDIIVTEPPKGAGVSLRIRYRL